MSNPVVILIRPQMGENIGAVARAMSNFGLQELRIVSPRDGWPNPKATEMAASGEDIIEQAKIFDSTEEAIADLQVLYATTARTRDIEKPVLPPDHAMQQLTAQAHSNIRTAFVFGPERTGLSNDDLKYCDTLINIPTASKNPSLNIAQATVIIGYSWLCAQTNTPDIIRTLPQTARKDEWELMFKQLEGYLDKSGYFRVDKKKPVMWQNLRNMLQRSQLNTQELRSFRGMLRSLWEHKHTDH